jgi:cob(I)alamin adenosyltransferase
VPVKGLVHIYTGNGKGKTSAALGLCLRALGHGLKCCFLQFLKGAPTGELQAAKLLPNFYFRQLGRPDYDFKPTPEDALLAQKGLELAKELAPKFNVMVLDEVVVAVHLKLLPLKELLHFVKTKPKELELVLTGRHSPKELLEVAHYVTHFQLLKHPYYKGEPARKGIDY